MDAMPKELDTEAAATRAENTKQRDGRLRLSRVRKLLDTASTKYCVNEQGDCGYCGTCLLIKELRKLPGFG